MLKSLKAKVLLAVIVIVAASVGISAMINYKLAERVLISQVDFAGMTLVRESAGKLDYWFKARKAEVESLADSEQVKSMIKAWWMPYLQKKLKEFKVFCDFGVVDNSGTFHGVKHKSADMRNFPFFKETFSRKETIISSVLFKEEPYIVISSPIKDKSGKVIGLILGCIPNEKLIPMLSEMKFGRSGYAYIIDKSGNAVVHPNKKYIMKVNLLNPSSKVRLPSELVSIAKRMISGEVGKGEYTFKGVVKIAYFAPLKEAPFSLAITIPKGELLTPLYSIYKGSLIVGIIAIVVSFVVLFFLISKLHAPFGEMMSIMRKVGEGDLTGRLEVKGALELREIAEGFNAMINKIEKLVNLLKDRVRRVEDTVAKVSEVSVKLAESSGKIEEISKVAVSSTETTAGAAETATAGIEEVASGTQMAANASQRMANVVEEIKNLAGEG